jgi:hypothetical protein
MKHIPNEEQIEQMLETLPPQISRRLDQRLANAPWMSAATPQGERMGIARPRRLQRPALIALTVLALTAVALVTPPGRAFAQQILQFFRRSESSILPLPGGGAPGAENTLAPTAPPPAPLVSVAEAEKTAGFDAKELPVTPGGLTFAGAMATQAGISIQYQADGNGGQLIINESTGGFVQSDWDQAPAEAIRPVKIGELDGEIVRGAYVVYPNETSARWNPDAAILRLRWIQDGIWFEMAKFGDVESISYLDRDALIALAESMVYAP